MASSFKLVLDTTAPIFSGDLDAGIPITNIQEVALRTLLEGPDDTEPLAGYQIKVWGDVDATANPDIQETEEASEWISYGELLEKLTTVFLSEGDGSKTIEVKIRDDVWNESASQEFSIEVDTSAPIITITAGPTPGKISKVTGKRLSVFTFKSSENLINWETWVVPSAGTAHEAGGFIINDSGPSENLSGGELEAEKNQTVKIDGEDLQKATEEDGEFIIKVFGQSEAGNWSL